MASGGETGYWPGFVDALSNMVMTLIIIIVLLNVALVYFFFKANKNTSQSVQSAIETTQKASATEIEALQKENQRLNDELQQMREKSEAVVAEQKPTAPSKQSADADANKDPITVKQTDKNHTDQQQSKNTTPVAAQSNLEATQNQDYKAKEVAVQGEAQGSPQTNETQAQALIKEEKIENNYNNKKGQKAELNKNSVATQSSNEIVIVYEDDNVEFSPSTLISLNNELGGLISRNKNIKIEILVEIVENKGYSFSRRLAYYRASAIRNFALTKGAEPSRIVSKLVPSAEGAKFSRAIIRVSP